MMFVIVLNGCGDSPKKHTTLAAPTNISVVANPGSVTVSWMDQSGDETGFLLLRQDVVVGAPFTDSQDFEEHQVLRPNVNSYIDSAVTLRRSYRYAVVSVRGNERSHLLGPSLPITPLSEGIAVVDPNDEVGTSLNHLGIDTTPSARSDATGSALPPTFLPLGSVVTINKRDELLVVGGTISGGTTPQRIVEIDDAAQHTTMQLDPFANYAAELHSTPHAAAAGDFDGDGLQEIAMVYLSGADIEVRYVDDSEALFVESTFTVATPATTPAKMVVTNADLDGDGIDSVVVGLGATDAAELWVLGNASESFARSDVIPFDGTVSGALVSLALASGNIDNDSPEEIAVVINEAFQDTGVDRGVSRYAILDDADANLVEMDSGYVQGQDGPLYATMVTDVATADVDDDGYDEIILGGLVDLITTCANNEILTIVLDDAAPGHDLGTLGVEYRQVSFGGTCSAANPTLARFIHVTSGNLDDDGGEEFTVAHVVYDDWSNPFAEWGYVPPSQMFGNQSGFTLNDVNTAVTIADVDGDGRGEIYAVAPDVTALRGYPVADVLPQTPTALVADPTLQWSFSATTYGARPILLPVNIDGDSIVAQAGTNAGPPAYEYVLTEPIVLAALAAAPCYEAGSQNIDACGTSYGTGESGSTTNEGGVAVKVGVSFGAKAIGGALTQSELTAKVNVNFEYKFGFGNTYTVEKNIVYSTGPLEDGVLFVSVPYDIYRYTIVQHPDPSRIGQIEEIRLPRNPITVLVERSYYNSAVPSSAFQIDSRVFSHTPGAPHSYLSSAQKDALISTLEADPTLQSGNITVGQGTGTVSATIDVSTDKFRSHSFALEVEYEVEAVGGTILAGYSVGVTGEYALTVSTGTSTSFGATVGNIADPSAFANTGYDFGLFTYRYDIPGGGQFHVINYWVD